MIFCLNLKKADRYRVDGLLTLKEASCQIVIWLFFICFRPFLYRYSVRNVAMVLVAAVALGSSTYAWFVSNSSVRAEMTSVSAAASTANLLIEECTTAGTKKTTGGSALASQSVGATVALYPSSLATTTVAGNGSNEWFVVNSWSDDVKANGYTVPTITKPTSGNGAGSYTMANGQTGNAYAIASYTLYTTTGTVDVYLDNATDRAIVVENTNSSTPADSKIAMQALRVGIVVDGTLKLVYAPYAEASAGGNDASYTTTTKTYKAVSSATAAGDAPYAVLAGTSGALAAGDLTADDSKVYSAVKNADGTFSAPTTAGMKLGTADSQGILVEVYVWIEGTDTECTTDLIAGDDDVYKININFAGVTPSV